MSLALSNTPTNNTTSVNTPLFQDWAPGGTNPGQDLFHSNSFTSNVPIVEKLFSIKDVISNPDFLQYTEFRLFGQKFFLFPNSTPFIAGALFRNPDGLPSDINSGPIALTENGKKIKLVYYFQNLYYYAVGNYEHFTRFVIEGKLPNGNWVTVSNYTFITTLHITNTFVTYNPASLDFIHYQNTVLPFRNLTLNGDDWVLVGIPNFVLSSATPGVTIESFGSGSGVYQTASGSGLAVITVTLGTFYDIGTIATADLTRQIVLQQGISFTRNIPITVQVNNQNTFDANPRQLEFFATKSIEEPSAQSVLVFCTELPFTFVAPPWLTIVVTNLETTQPEYKVLSVVPIPTANMEVGQYEGTIVITATIAGITSTISIDVTYDLQGFIQSPYPVNGKAFTLDPLFYQFTSAYLETYFKITAIIQTFDFFTDEVKQYTLLEKLPKFNNKANLNFGKTIHKLMARFNEINQNLYQYKPALFSMLVEEIDIATGDVIRTANLQQQQFVAGLSRGITNDIGFLDFNQKPARVTPNSVHIFNVLGVNNNYDIQIIKADELVGTINLGSTHNRILAKQFSFAEFTQGDILTFNLIEAIGITENVQTALATKTFHVIPPQPYSCNVYWEDEFLLQSVLEFTGVLNVKSDLEFRSNNLFQNLVELLEMIETTKVSKLTINTGWLINNSIDTIESLMRSKRAWIDLNGKRVALVPMSKQIVSNDSERQLVDFTIEFQINRNYDQETFTS